MAGIKDTINSLNSAQDFLNQNNPLNPSQSASYKSNGFLLPAAYTADGNGLPYEKVPNNRPGQMKRNNITWFIPEFGIVRMYVNPQRISYHHRKIINKDLTKGGYTLQYWGEDLSELSINGNTGSSGIEGINVLYEMYRAEQYAFDAVGLTLGASNAAADLASKAVDSLGGVIGGGVSALFGGSFGNQSAQAAGSGLLSGILGVDSPNNNALASKNIMSLAQLAFGVEMYYNGWVFRGYFNDMTIDEDASDFLIKYQIKFMVTQKRGYRLNYFPWSRSPDGPSQYDSPTSFDLQNIVT